MVFKDFFIRNLEADTYRETFLVTSVVALFIIRIFLKLTHYPQLARGELHIAHIVWGGFFMMAAIIILLSFMSKTSANIASVLGGIGFGAFIDELGKFITRDNDYFFQPTIALIYIIFVLIFLLLKFIPHYREISQKEYLVNAMEMIKEAVINDFDVEEEQRAALYLKKCDPNDPIVQALSRLLLRLDAVPAPKPGIFTRIRILIRNWYYTVAKSGIIIKVIILFLAFQTVDTIFNTALLVMIRPVLPFSQWGKLYSSGLAAMFIIMGLFALKFSKVEAYRFFRIAMLITILLTEFFAFMQTQWLELIPLTANLFILMVINYATYMERQKTKEKILNTLSTAIEK